MPLNAEEIERYRLVLELRRKGEDWGRIAMLLKVDLVTAERLAKRAVKALLRDSAEEVRTQELNRLEELERTLWQEVKGNEAKRECVAFDRLLRLIALRLEWSGCRPAPLPVQIADNRLQIVIQTFAAPADTKALPAPIGASSEASSMSEALELPPAQSESAGDSEDALPGENEQGESDEVSKS